MPWFAIERFVRCKTFDDVANKQASNCPNSLLELVGLVIERAVLRLELHDCETGDHLEVANVGRRHAIAEFKCRHTDEQIRQRQPQPSGLILAVDSPARTATAAVTRWIGNATCNSWIN